MRLLRRTRRRMWCTVPWGDRPSWWKQFNRHHYNHHRVSTSFVIRLRLTLNCVEHAFEALWSIVRTVPTHRSQSREPQLELSSNMGLIVLTCLSRTVRLVTANISREDLLLPMHARGILFPLLHARGILFPLPSTLSMPGDCSATWSASLCYGLP